MLEKIKANILFNKLLQRPDINRAYAMVPETDSWYDTISNVHNSLAEIQKKDHEIIEIKNMMIENGALGAVMSGSGPSVFGLFDSEENAKKVRKALTDYGIKVIN